MKLSKLIIIIELIIILSLSAVLIKDKYPSSNQENQSLAEFKLLSPRITSGLLAPKSFLIVNYDPLRETIERYVKKNNLNVSVYVENLRSGAFIGINEKEGYSPASLNKVPVAILVMKQIEDGKLTLDTMLDIKDSDRTSAFGTLYKTKEKKLPVSMLMEKMLQESDDTAFKILNDVVDENDKALFLNYFNYYTADSADNTLPGEDSEYGLVTPKSMYNVFLSLYLSTLLEPKDSQYILSFLANTTFDINKISKLPSNITVVQKFAIKYDGKEKLLHSCGIIYIESMRVFYCVMTTNLDEKSATRTIGAVVRAIYDYTIDTRNKLDYYKNLIE